jgi:hypothetical protein
MVRSAVSAAEKKATALGKATSQPRPKNSNGLSLGGRPFLAAKQHVSNPSFTLF